MITSKLLNWPNTSSKGRNLSMTHECPPFAIINPDDYEIFTNEKGERCIKYGRKYGWGFCNAFSDEYSDFGRLYKLIISKKLNINNLLDILWT